MISDPSLILYACVSKGTTVLAELSSGGHDLETLALQCLEKTPHFHVTFSHTSRKRIYSFLMEDPFIYFAILDEDLGKSHGFRFLERVKDAFVKILKTKSIDTLDNLTSHCFHEEFSPIFRRLMASSGKVRALHSPDMASKDGRNGSLDSRSACKKAVSAPLLGKLNKHWKKKMKLSDKMNDRDIPTENKVDVSDDANQSQELTVSLQKNGSYIGHGGRQQAQKMWRRHVWTVLLIDLAVCCVLLGIWLWICRGFECISG